MYFLTMYGLLSLVPLLVSALVRKRFLRAGGFFLSVLLSSSLMTSAVVVSWLVHDRNLALRIETLDRNGDGVWSRTEEATWTPQERKDLESHINDGGRNVFAAVIFPVLSVLYSLLSAGLYWGIAGLGQRMRARKDPPS